MQFSTNKKRISITFVLILMMASVTLMSMPVQAQQVLPAGVTPTNLQEGGSSLLPTGVTPDATIDTIPHISFRPNPIGIGQPLLVNIWMQPSTHASRYFKGYTVTITKPDGTKVTIGPINSYIADTTAWFEYIVDQIGTWKLKFDFPGGYFPPGNYTSNASLTLNQISSFTQSVYYKPSSTPEYNLTVQEAPAASWPPAPLPTDYWTRPISLENREWSVIGGNYPFTGHGGGSDWPANTNTYASNYLFTPWVQAPNTAHIVWKRQASIDGLVGGQTGQASLTTAVATPSIVYEGRCYQTITEVSPTGTGSQTFWQCYDLRTGALYWERPIYSGESAPTAINYYYNPPAVAGGGTGVPGSQAREPLQVSPSLVSIGTRLVKYDPLTGVVTLNVTGMTGTFYSDPYVLSVQTNNTAAGNRLINWSIASSSTNFADRIISNITWPFGSLGVVDYEACIAVTTQAVTPPSTGVATELLIMASSLTTGKLMWNVSSGVGYPLFSGSTSVADQGKFAVRFDNGYWYCWDLNTGNKLWKSELSSEPWGTFGCYGVQSYGGMIIANQYDGVAAYNWTNGKLVWLYQAKAPYPYETVYQDNYPWFTPGSRIADGKLYTFNTEHTPTSPITRGWKLHCINMTTGEGIWNITGTISPGAVADGYLVGGDTYDGYMYVFGKGQSSTTVSAPQIAITQGQSVVLTGTVLDQSPGQQGTPCVSKESMASWMEYLHMQHAIPANVKGVPVSIDTVDPNGNYAHIATVTSDMSGTFGYTWTPTIPGQYQITATFIGDDSYGSSWAQTYATVTQAAAPSPTATQTPITMPPFEIYIAGSTITIIVAIALVGLMLRKRP